MPEGVGIPAERDTVKPRFGALNDCFAALMAATKFHFDGPKALPPPSARTRCQKNVVSSLREMPANAVWPANIFLAIACDSVTQAWDARTYRVRPAVGGRSSKAERSLDGLQ